MFGLFKKDPVKKLEKEYQEIMSKAMTIQRSGDLRHYAELIKEAESVQQKIEAIKNAPDA